MKIFNLVVSSSLRGQIQDGGQCEISGFSTRNSLVIVFIVFKMNQTLQELEYAAQLLFVSNKVDFAVLFCRRQRVSV